MKMKAFGQASDAKIRWDASATASSLSLREGSSPRPPTDESHTLPTELSGAPFDKAEFQRTTFVLITNK